ncbi:MAG: cytochrome P450 [Synoicihabitans sp.]
MPGLFKYLARHADDVVTFRAATRHQQFLFRHPDAVREILVTQSDKFNKGPAFAWLRNAIGNSLLVSEGGYHRSQYQLMASFFSRTSVSSYRRSIVDITEELMSHWNVDETIDASLEMHRLSLRILAKTLFNLELGSQCDEILAAATEIGRQPKNLSRKLFPLSRFVNALPLPENVRLKRAVATLDRIVYGWIDDRRKEGLAGADLLTSLIQSAGSSANEATDRQIRDEVVGFLIVGHETISAALGWSFYCLSEYPEVEQHFHRELDRILAGKRVPDHVDVESFEYARGFFAEVLRLFPPSYAVTRFAIEDCQIGDTHIPKGSRVTLSSFITHRDSRFFPNPNVFDPERWVSNQTEPEHRNAYFPFGAGARQCIGGNFAKQEAILILATIGRKWRLSRVENGPVELDAGLSLSQKDGLKMQVILRSSNSEI